MTGESPLDGLALEERFVRSAGPGGQNVNKVATAVELRVDVARSALAPEVKERLAVLAGSRMTTEGMLLITAREHRTQSQNRQAARARLEELVRRAHAKPKKRRATRPSKAAKERRLTGKRHRSDTKRARARRPSDD